MIELRKLRLEKGLTQAELAKKAGVSEISIRKYEDGSRNPKIQTLIKLADALQVSLLELQYGILPDDSHKRKLDNTLRNIGKTIKDAELLPLGYLASDNIDNTSNAKKIVLDDVADKNHPFNIVLNKIENRQILSPEENRLFRELQEKGLSNMQQYLETFSKSITESFYSYYKLLNDEGRLEAELQIQRIVKKAIAQATDEIESQVQLLSKIPAYQSKTEK